MKEILSTASAAIIAAVAVATCAAAPEFIWQGLKVILTHLSWATFVSAALVALLLVFFVEPILERFRGWLSSAAETKRTAGRHLAIAAAVGFFIALVSVGLHDAMTAFTAGDEGEAHAGLQRAVTVTISWGAVPFAVTLAWQAATHRLLAIPLGVAAAASSFVAGWTFDWGVMSTVTTAIPCLLIQAAGYSQARAAWQDSSFARYAPALAIAAVAWLICAPIYDALSALWNSSRTPLYDLTDYLVDARFYFGWCLGLVLTRSPVVRHAAEP